MSRAISVLGGSVQLRLRIADQTYFADVWSEGEGWNWTARLEGVKSLKHGHCLKWSEARTAAFRACLQHARGDDRG